ncbi:MAG: Hpt domain-containing protein [Pseudomonadota bacterium]
MKPSSKSTAAPVARPEDEPDTDLDEGILTKLEEVMGSRVEEVVQSYIADSPDNVERIREALSGSTMEAVGACAHELKSTSASLGVISVKKLCQSIELAARDSDVDQIKKDLEQLPEALDRAIQALRDFKPVAA